MKKIYSLLFVLLISLFFIPNVYAADNVSIESVTLDSKSDSAEVVNEASFEGLNIKFDVRFSAINDFVKYKVVIDNKSNQDYEISEGSISDSQYIKYEYNFDDNNEIAEKNKKTTLFITIKYNKVVPNDLLVNGKYNEEKALTISLGDKENVINPSTASSLFIIIFLAFITLIISIALFKTNKTTLSILVIMFLLVPITVVGIEKIEIKVDSKIEIETPTFCVEFINEGETLYYPYEMGMNWMEYFDSSYNDNLFVQVGYAQYIAPQGYDYNLGRGCNYLYIERDGEIAYEPIDIMNSREGCYTFKYEDSCK